MLNILGANFGRGSWLLVYPHCSVSVWHAYLPFNIEASYSMYFSRLSADDADYFIA